MTPEALLPAAPWETLAVCLLLFVAPLAAVDERPRAAWLALLAGTIVVALFATSGVVAYAAVATAALVHAWLALPKSRTGAATLAVSAALAVGAGAAAARHELTTAFALSTAAIALRAGLPPVHLGVASLCERAPLVQLQQLASTIALVFVHLRFVDHDPAVAGHAVLLVRYGAFAALAAALVTLVQRDLRGFYRSTTVMHGALLIAGLGAATRGNFAAALLVAVTVGLALGGLAMLIASLEARVGPVSLAGPGGRAGAFPRLAAAFACFGGAGVGLPGTAGFVADDLLLHTLWAESPAGAVAVILATALLAVATLIVFARTFLGRTVASPAPDLRPRERAVAALLLAALVALGLAPGVLLGPADGFLDPPPVSAAR